MTLDLEAIRARLAAATPGPWAWDSRGDKASDIQVGVAADRWGIQLEGFIEDGADAVYIGGIAKDIEGPQNAAFIAHAPADVRALIGEVESLRLQLHNTQTRMKEAQEQVEHLHTELDQCHQGAELIRQAWVADADALRAALDEDNEAATARIVVAEAEVESLRVWQAKVRELAGPSLAALGVDSDPR